MRTVRKRRDATNVLPTHRLPQALVPDHFSFPHELSRQKLSAHSCQRTTQQHNSLTCKATQYGINLQVCDSAQHAALDQTWGCQALSDLQSLLGMCTALFKMQVFSQVKANRGQTSGAVPLLGVAMGLGTWPGSLGEPVVHGPGRPASRLGGLLHDGLDLLHLLQLRGNPLLHQPVVQLAHARTQILQEPAQTFTR